MSLPENCIVKIVMIQIIAPASTQRKVDPIDYQGNYRKHCFGLRPRILDDYTVRLKKPVIPQKNAAPYV
jgi:hypothetical protein